MLERQAASASNRLQYLLDSDWIIGALRGVPSATEAIDRLRDSGIGVSINVLGELYDGAVLAPESAERLAGIRRYIANLPLVDLSDEVMEVFARNRAGLRVSGQRWPNLDLLIAATALVHDLVLMTRNVRHFERILDLKIYRT